MRPASEAERARLAETFVELCRIDSSFGRERACSQRVAAELRGMGLEVTEDDAAAASGAECGNLLARIAGRADRSILFCAHLDTVEATAPIDPVIIDGGWENTHDGILGADNKAAVAVMLEVARRAALEGAPVGLELLFTVSEENALAGVKAFDADSLRSEFGYVFDHASPIGQIVTASPTYFRLAAEFHGRAAHAGVRPEAGRSAVVAAAHAIGAMPLGRLDAETTANVGSIAGGVGSTNVVPERCRLLAEARSLDPERVETVMAQLVDAVHDGASFAECDVDVVVERLFEGYKAKPSSPPVAVAEAALRACGYEPTRIATGGGSDANVLMAAGFPCVNLANGTQHNHEPIERVSIAALEDMLDVAYELLEHAAAVPA
ncbi:MAG: M20/M25/M40 family metallo-hydrolase [Solirubrobacterales bacterium]|nr:M20/M25/M40 family metallo-hydrolase [Solirubrobacterales bacterium]